jgi:hypothetical protein
MMNISNTTENGLRKRNKVTDTRERSVSPTNTTSTHETPKSSDKTMYNMLETLTNEFPEIFFTDEFNDAESGTTTCLIGGLTSGLDDLLKYDKIPFDLKFEDGRLCLTYTAGNRAQVMIKKAKITKIQVFIVILWVFSSMLTFFLMSTFSKKYSEWL